MLRTVLFLMLLISPLTLFAMPSNNTHAASCVAKNDMSLCKLNASGPINLLQTTGKLNAKNIFLELSGQVAGELRLYHSEEKDSHVIKGSFVLDNFSDDTLYVQYRVIFKDKKGAVAQTRGDIHLDKGERQKVRFSTIVLREQDIKNITRYEIRTVASDDEMSRR